MLLSQVVLLPLLALFTWGYLALRPASRRRTALALYDAVVVVIAILSSVAAARLAADLYGDPDNRIWRVVMATVATFHVFPAVLLAGWYVRRLIFASASR